ncbi:unnamed protein product [Tetraodon nigroviridis]|uniref:E3 ubiquitin-protein ligase RNF26 n=1 Tax=Tetraodon nigroviridis TaxID=99883 RepID=Q4SPD0_TETNG|nr:unnamed protein product [Tetraodon nigroviridis]
MGLLNLVISTVSKCLDVVCLLLDLNFLVVHTVMRTVVGVITFITSLPTLLLTSLAELGNCVVFGVISLAEASSNVAQGTVTMLGSIVLALEGLLESLKMMGYLTMHVLLRGKEQLCRGLVSLLEGCGIALSLVVYFTNTVVNFVLIATQNVYVAVVSVLQTLSCPLQKALELALTCLTCVSSSLAGTSAFLWSPCKVVLDFLISLVHMFMSIFILNVYGLLLTVTIALTTTAYLNPELSRHAATRVLGYVNSHAAVRRLFAALRAFASAASYFLRAAVRHLPRMLHHLCSLERRLWEHLSGLSSQLALARRAPHRRDRRAHADGDPGDQRRDPPDGRAGEPLHREAPSSSRIGPPGEQIPTKAPAENLLSLLKEQEDRKKCVICQDANKTVVLLPCRHLCLCRGCTSILLRQPLYQHNCPLCRRMILDTMDVYL